MRFAWIKKHAAEESDTAQQGSASPFIRLIYNAVWWIPVLLPFIGMMDYRTGFITFAIITVIRLIANLYRNNVLTPAQAEIFPFRA